MQDPIIVDQPPARPPRRTYSNEFKANAVALCERGDRSLAQVAMDLKINANLVRRWQKERREQSSGTKMLPVQVAHPGSATTDAAYIELHVRDLAIKVVGNIDCHYLTELIRALR